MIFTGGGDGKLLFGVSRVLNPPKADDHPPGPLPGQACPERL
jgi:hypothetical protein